MDSDKRNRRIALLSTLVFAALTALVVSLLKLSYNPSEAPTWPPVDSAELLFAGEFVQVGDIPEPVNPDHTATADNDGSDQPTADGEDMTEAGPVAPEPPATTVSKQPSPMKVKEQKPAEPGASKANDKPAAEPKREQKQPERIPLKTVDFNKNKGKASNSGAAGSPDGNATQGALSGSVGYQMSGRSITVSAPSVSSKNEKLEGKRVVITIFANPEGRLIGTPTIDAKRTTVGDAIVRRRCLEKAAQAKVSPNPDAPKSQQGTIIFNFSNK